MLKVDSFIPVDRLEWKWFSRLSPTVKFLNFPGKEAMRYTDATEVHTQTKPHTISRWHLGKRPFELNSFAFIYCKTVLYSLPVGGGNQEDVTTRWPVSWTKEIGSCSSPPLSLGGTLCPPFPQWELFQGQSLERVKCCWGHLDGVCDWIYKAPTYTLRFWQAGAVTYLFHSFPGQASDLYLLAL